MASGIYRIHHSGGGRYIGSALNLASRISAHIRDLSNGRHSNVGLQSAWNTAGGVGVSFEILERCDEAELPLAERRWLDTEPSALNVRDIPVTRRRPRRVWPQGQVFRINGQEFLSYQEAARVFGVAPGTVGRWVRDGGPDVTVELSSPRGSSLPKPVEIDGVHYQSVGAASRSLGVDRKTIRRMLSYPSPAGRVDRYAIEMDGHRFFSRRAAARHYGVHVSTLIVHYERGTVPSRGLAS